MDEAHQTERPVQCSSGATVGSPLCCRPLRLDRASCREHLSRFSCTREETCQKGPNQPEHLQLLQSEGNKNQSREEKLEPTRSS